MERKNKVRTHDMHDGKSLSHIVVEGPIGVGKTSLARRLAETFDAQLMLEDASSNPFLERFYSDARHAALPTQMYFLLQRARQIQSLRQNQLFTSTVVSDFLLEKDPLFARLTLDEDELALYDMMYQSLALDAPVPDLVVYLQAPVDVLFNRVRKRGSDYERMIDTAYLKRVSDAYAEFFYRYDASALLIVNAADIDLVNNPRDYQQLVDHMRRIRSGRHYLNPLPIAL
jgi:deoxyadenosine/deoxycytidine kinase